MSRQRHKPPSQRQLRVGESLRHSLAEILARAPLNDPDLAGVSITVSEVRCSPDLRKATVFVSPLGGGDVARLLAGLGRAAPWLRQQLSRSSHLKHLPSLAFEADTSFDTASHIDGLLRQAGIGAADIGAADIGVEDIGVENIGVEDEARSPGDGASAGTTGANGSKPGGGDGA